MTSQNGLYKPGPVEHLTGAERFSGIDATVRDFWKFALSDLKMNNARGYLAEFIVARALGLAVSRTEWANYDLLWDDKGITIEVKASAKLQAWQQYAHSRVQFTGLKGRQHTHGDGRGTIASFNAMVYVFGVQTAEEHEKYDALDIDQWVFYVASRGRIATLNQASVSLRTLQKMIGCERVSFAELADAIEAAATAADNVES